MGCACRSVRLAQVAGVMGILLSCLVITPPLLSFVLEDDLALVQPVIQFMQELLENEHKKEVITRSTLKNLKDFLSGFGENIEFTSIFIISASSLNIFMDIFMLIGSCCNVSCLLLPWLIVSMLKLIIIWVPVVIFFALLGVYLYVQNETKAGRMTVELDYFSPGLVYPLCVVDVSARGCHHDLPAGVDYGLHCLLNYWVQVHI